VSAIRTALASGDLDTARTVMLQFIEEHRDELPAPHDGDRDNRRPDQLARLEEQGFDVSSIRAAIANGDMDSARTLLQQFLEEHRHELADPPCSNQDDRVLGSLDQLEKSGYNMTEIRAAVTSGDLDTARTLMQQFLNEHRDELTDRSSHSWPGSMRG
jgi:DNA-binding FadR family transcriptional regulator